MAVCVYLPFYAVGSLLVCFLSVHAYHKCLLLQSQSSDHFFACFSFSLTSAHSLYRIPFWASGWLVTHILLVYVWVWHVIAVHLFRFSLRPPFVVVSMICCHNRRDMCPNSLGSMYHSHKCLESCRLYYNLICLLLLIFVKLLLFSACYFFLFSYPISDTLTYAWSCFLFPLNIWRAFFSVQFILLPFFVENFQVSSIHRFSSWMKWCEIPCFCLLREPMRELETMANQGLLNRS